MLDTYFGHIVNKAKSDAEAVLKQFGISKNELDDYQAVFTDYGVGFVGGQLPEEIEKIMFPDGISNGDGLVEGEYINPIENLGGDRKTVLLAAVQLWATCRFLLNRRKITTQEACLAGYSIGRLRLALEYPVVAENIVIGARKKDADEKNKSYTKGRDFAREEANKLWSIPPVLDKWQMIEAIEDILEPKLEEFKLKDMPKKSTIWSWIKDLAPEVVRKPGRR